MEKPLIDKKYLLKKFPGKGGWTYAEIPEILMSKSNPFGWVRVRGSVDHYELKNCHLAPMGNGRLFLPVKAEIRKKIGKREGDWVKVILYEDNSPIEIPEDILICLKDEPEAYKTFLSYAHGEQKAFIDWVVSAKKEETKVGRIVKMIEKLLDKRKFGE